jgi:hypothetical protein
MFHPACDAEFRSGWSCCGELCNTWSTAHKNSDHSLSESWTTALEETGTTPLK